MRSASEIAAKPCRGVFEKRESTKQSEWMYNIFFVSIVNYLKIRILLIVFYHNLFDYLLIDIVWTLIESLLAFSARTITKCLGHRERKNGSLQKLPIGGMKTRQSMLFIFSDSRKQKSIATFFSIYAYWMIVTKFRSLSLCVAERTGRSENILNFSTFYCNFSESLGVNGLRFSRECRGCRTNSICKCIFTFSDFL